METCLKAPTLLKSNRMTPQVQLYLVKSYLIFVLANIMCCIMQNTITFEPTYNRQNTYIMLQITLMDQHLWADLSLLIKLTQISNDTIQARSNSDFDVKSASIQFYSNNHNSQSDRWIGLTFYYLIVIMMRTS
jgi:hypothetical protein